MGKGSVPLACNERRRSFCYGSVFAFDHEQLACAYINRPGLFYQYVADAERVADSQRGVFQRVHESAQRNSGDFHRQRQQGNVGKLVLRKLAVAVDQADFIAFIDNAAGNSCL